MRPTPSPRSARAATLCAASAGLIALTTTTAWATPTVAARVSVRGAATETLTGRIPATSVVLGHDRAGQVDGVRADLTLRGSKGGTATVQIRLFKESRGWTGWIRLSDPGIHMDVRGTLHGSPVAHANIVSWSGKGAVAAGGVALTWTV